MDTGAVWPLGHRFHAADNPLLLQRYRHWTFAMRQGRTIGPIELPRAAKLTFAYLGTATPQLCGSLVKERDAPVGVGCVDRCG